MMLMVSNVITGGRGLIVAFTPESLPFDTMSRSPLRDNTVHRDVMQGRFW